MLLQCDDIWEDIEKGLQAEWLARRFRLGGIAYYNCVCTEERISLKNFINYIASLILLIHDQM